MEHGAEESDYGGEYGGSQKMRYQGSGAIPALADDEVIGDDDEYDDLYNDVNVGEGFQQMHQPVMQMPSGGASNGSFQAPNTNPPESTNRLPESKDGLAADRGQMGTTDSSQQTRGMGINVEVQRENLGPQGSNPMPQKISVHTSEFSVKVSGGAAPVLNTGMGHNQTNMNVNHSNSEHVRPPMDNGATMLFVGELHWWTTDAELEGVLSQYGRVKEIKFFDERASGKSKGYCQVEFYDSVAAAACKEGMNGYVFNGRACVVAFASPQTIRQMGSAYANKNQTQPQSQPLGRRPMNDGVGRGGGMNQQSNNGDGGRTFGGRGGWGRGGPGAFNRGPGSGPIRGRGGAMGGRNMAGGGPSGGAFGQGMGGPAFGGPLGGLMNPQGMMGAGFDPTFMGRGAGYGGFPGAAFPGMMPGFAPVNPMGLTGVSPHVNPAFFGRGMANNGLGMGMGMGMMGQAGMDGQQAMWSDTSMGGGGGEEYGQRTRESSYGGEDGGSEYGYGDGSQEKGAKSNAASREKDWGSERDWSGNSERKHRDERDMDKDRSERNHRYKEENDDWDRGQSSSRSRSRSKAVADEGYRRSRDEDYGKRRRMPSE